MRKAERAYNLFKKYYILFLKMSAISIDGFKRDRYIIKIKDMTDSVEFAKKQLLEEERNIERGAVSADEIPSSLERITGYLLQVETLLNEKAILMKKLEEKQTKWLDNDLIFKERKTTLRNLLRISMALACN